MLYSSPFSAAPSEMGLLDIVRRHPSVLSCRGAALRQSWRALRELYGEEARVVLDRHPILLRRRARAMHEVMQALRDVLGSEVCALKTTCEGRGL